jgi:hypothetical protein
MEGGGERGFARKENWKRHMRKQHGKNDESSSVAVFPYHVFHT